jgi:hypothetical protein
VRRNIVLGFLAFIVIAGIFSVFKYNAINRTQAPAQSNGSSAASAPRVQGNAAPSEGTPRANPNSFPSPGTESKPGASPGSDSPVSKTAAPGSLGEPGINNPSLGAPSLGTPGINNPSQGAPTGGPAYGGPSQAPPTGPPTYGGPTGTDLGPPPGSTVSNGGNSSPSALVFPSPGTAGKSGPSPGSEMTDLGPPPGGSPQGRPPYRRGKLGFVLSVLGQLGTVVALVAVIVALREGHKQRKLQLKLSLFDKRFSVFRRADDFVNLVLREQGRFDIKTDYMAFVYAKEEAQFLFPRKSAIRPYLEEIRSKAMELSAATDEIVRARVEGKPEETVEIKELMRHFLDETTSKKLAEAFGEYLQFD